MFVSGFTFIRNAVKLDYPVVESINSIIDICDEFIVLVGNSDDETEQLIRGINNEKIKIHHSTWDDSIRVGGRVLAKETIKAFAHISPKADWAFYLQADEVVHEQYLETIKAAMLQYKDDSLTEGLLFHYAHFYGSYHFLADSRKWYRKEIRVIRNDKRIRSYRDAQGFRKSDKKLLVRQIDAFIYHYGWVKSPEKQQIKQRSFNKLWHSDEWVDTNLSDSRNYNYAEIDSLSKFTGTHPEVMKKRVALHSWNFDFDLDQKKLSLLEKISFAIERAFGWRIGEYKNYRIIS
ncbi:glycosyl transferase [Chryseotalea sanaruensis]|uniref:Glycosyl transferase n=1 Tax=Chryseotalea sanaruensis TaxID=2482724 RepID=A0A401U9Q7_9BACT|nr:glycosyltransferase family 2 protein [Chryseotalea sanaruensis]GCC51621.1 glycosyl transferase [Chryseotalea sanaruensis]